MLILIANYAYYAKNNTNYAMLTDTNINNANDAF